MPRVLSLVGIAGDAFEGGVEFADGPLQFGVAVSLFDLGQDGVDLALAGPPLGLQLQTFAEGVEFGVRAELVALLGVAHQFA